MKKYYLLLRRALRWLGRFEVPMYAANASFYIVLSVLPTVLLLVSLLPYTIFSEADLLEALKGLVPELLFPFLEQVFRDMRSSTSTALVSVSAIAAIWSSSRGIYCVRLGLNRIFGFRERRNYLLRRSLSMGYMLLLLAALLLTLGIHVFGRELSALCRASAIPVIRFLADLLQFRGLILLLFLTGAFTAIYCVLPNRRLQLRQALPGAAAAALGWLLFTGGYSWYVHLSGSYSVLYGGLSILTASMLWLYVCMCLLFYGGVLNVLLQLRREA